MYGGVRLQGLGTPVVTGCTFQTISYGIYNFCNGFSTTSANTFVTASLSVDINTTGDALVSGNTFAADGILGIQIQRGAPVVTGNTFEGDHNAIYGAIRVSINGAGTARNNIFDCATSPCVRIGSAGQFDLGTVGSPGGNVFGGASGIAVQHDGADTVFAVGNVWHSTPPVCGSHIVIAGAGRVIWGADPTEQCP